MSYDSIGPARLVIRIFHSIGFWSYSGQRHYYWYKAYGWVFAFTFIFLFFTGEFINILRTDNIDDFSDALYMSFAQSVLLVKTINMLLISDKIVGFIRIVEQHTQSQPQNEKEVLMMQRSQASYSKIRDFYIFGCILTLILADIQSLMDPRYKLPFPCWMPFDYRNAQNFPYAFLYVAISIFASASTNMAMDLMQAFLLFQSASFYRLISMRLESYGQPEDVDELKSIMKLHNFAERMVVKCQDIISVPVFTQVLMSAFIICFGVYQCQKLSLINEPTNFITLLLFAIMMAMQIYFPCYYGNELMISADALTGSAYKSNWVNLSPESKKLLFIYMEYLKRPIYVKAGNFFVIGMNVFTRTINNAYSLLALLLNMKK